MSSLPDELVSSILSLLPARDVLRCAQGNRRFNRITQDNIGIWQQVYQRRSRSRPNPEPGQAHAVPDYMKAYRWRYSDLWEVPKGLSARENNFVWDLALDEEKRIVIAVTERNGLEYWKFEDGGNDGKELQLKLIQSVKPEDTDRTPGQNYGTIGATGSSKLCVGIDDLMCAWYGMIQRKDLETGRTKSTINIDSSNVPTITTWENLIFAGCTDGRVLIFDARLKPQNPVVCRREEGTPLALMCLPSSCFVIGGRFPALSLVDIRNSSKLLKALYTGVDTRTFAPSTGATPYTVHSGGFRKLGSLLDTFDLTPGQEQLVDRTRLSSGLVSAITSSSNPLRQYVDNVDASGYAPRLVTSDWNGNINLFEYEWNCKALRQTPRIIRKCLVEDCRAITSIRMGEKLGIIVGGSDHGVFAARLGKASRRSPQYFDIGKTGRHLDAFSAALTPAEYGYQDGDNDQDGLDAQVDSSADTEAGYGSWLSNPWNLFRGNRFLP